MQRGEKVGCKRGELIVGIMGLGGDKVYKDHSPLSVCRLDSDAEDSFKRMQRQSRGVTPSRDKEGRGGEGLGGSHFAIISLTSSFASPGSQRSRS